MARNGIDMKELAEQFEQLWQQRKYNIEEIAKMMNISKSSLYGKLDTIARMNNHDDGKKFYYRNYNSKETDNQDTCVDNLKSSLENLCNSVLEFTEDVINELEGEIQHHKDVITSMGGKCNE